MRKFLGWDNDSSRGEAKAVHKQTNPRNSFPTCRGQVFSHSQESQAPSHRQVTQEGKCHHSKNPSFPPSSPSSVWQTQPHPSSSEGNHLYPSTSQHKDIALQLAVIWHRSAPCIPSSVFFPLCALLALPPCESTAKPSFGRCNSGSV